MATYRLKEWFLTITGTANKAGTRFKDGDKPNESTFSDLFKSSLFKSEPDDRAKEDVAGTTLADINGHVVAATDAQAKANQAKKEDRTVVAQASQLPSVDSTDTLTISSIEELAYSSEPLNVVKDDTISTRSNYLIKFRDSFNTWLQVAASNIDDLRQRMVNVESKSNLNATNIANLTPSSSASSIPIGGVLVWLTSSVPTDFLALNGDTLVKTEYPSLYAIIGDEYTQNANSTTFDLPNMSGRFVAGATSVSNVGKGGGENSFTLKVQDLPPHAHDAGNKLIASSDFSNHTHRFKTDATSGQAYTGPEGFDVTQQFINPNGTNEVTTQSEGSHSHGITGTTGDVTNRGTQTTIDNRPLFLSVYYIIRAS